MKSEIKSLTVKVNCVGEKCKGDRGLTPRVIPSMNIHTPNTEESAYIAVRIAKHRQPTNKEYSQTIQGLQGAVSAVTL